MHKCLFLVLGCLSLAIAAPSKSPKAEDISNLELLDPSFAPVLSLLGTVGTKSYFVDYSDQRSWRVAKSYCESFGLRIASIESVEELAFLNRSYKDGIFDYSETIYLSHGEFILSLFWGTEFPYWVAAKDSHQMSQFHWDNKMNSPLTMDMEILTAREIGPSLTCGAIAPYPNQPAQFEMYACSRTNIGVLCQTK